jgi:transposase
MLGGPESLKSRKSPGRKPGLTKTRKKEPDKLITAGPSKCGFPGACWRSPMIQNLIYEKFGVFYSVHYISQLLKSMGFSYQKAKFVSDHHDPVLRQEWLDKKWTEIYRLALKWKAMILFGDEASFPQWGSLSYTWSKKGETPVVQTSGIRKGYKVFGLIDYFTGTFFCKGHEGRLNSESYAAFLTEVMQKTRKHIILIQDGARYHTSKAMKMFYQENSDRITVFDLPSYSPDYNPIEKLWKKIKEREIHLHYFPTFDALKNKVEKALLNFQDCKQEILKLFGFYNELSEQIL